MNLNIDISERDKKFLFIGIGLVLIFLSYMLGYKNIDAENKKLSEEVTKLKATFNMLQEKATQQSTYVEGTQEYTNYYNVYLNRFVHGNLEDEITMFYSKCEETTGAAITQVGIGDTVDAYTFGVLTPSDPDKEQEQKYGAPADYKGKSISYSLIVNGTYAQLKDVLKYISDGSGRKVVTDIAASYDNSTGLISATMTVVDYFIEMSDEEYKASIAKPQVDLGVTNIFNAASK